MDYLRDESITMNDDEWPTDIEYQNNLQELKNNKEEKYNLYLLILTEALQEKEVLI